MTYHKGYGFKMKNLIEIKLGLLKKVINETIDTVLGSEYTDIMLELSKYCLDEALGSHETDKTYKCSCDR